jgi:hypothetical protein
MTASTDTQVRAGWYPDPLGSPQLRWWDGRSWTSHTSTARTTSERMEARPVGYAEPADATAGSSEQSTGRHRAQTAPDGESAPTDRPFAPEQGALPAGTANAPELGWAGAALTLNSVQSTRVPMLIELGVAAHPTIVIDPRHQAYDWALDLEWFPDNPTGVVVSVELVGEAAPAPFALPGKSLDELLWKVGRAAFPERLAPWLEQGDGYRLTRWPNWTTLHPDTDHIRQTAMLANSVLTIEHLAGLSGRGIDTTRTLVNALSLMGVLYTIPAAQLVPTAAPAALPEGSLFQRLRQRFGL